MLLPQLLKHEILVMVMVMIMTVPDNIAGHTTCLAITTIYNTSVTCLFGEDISKLSFNVQFFFPNTSVDPEMILLCNKLMSGELTCYKGSQVLFDEKKEIVDRFKLSRPPSLTKLSGGSYQCHAVPSLREESHFCPLTYKDVLNFVPLESRCPQPPPPKVGSVVIQTFTMVAVVIVMIIAGVYLWTKRKSVFLWWSGRTAQRRSHGDVEDARENDECIALTTSTSECPQQTASPYTQPVTATTDSHQYPATSPVPPETQPSVRETSMPPCLDIEDPPVEKGTDVLEDETLMSEGHEAGSNTGGHGVGREAQEKEAERETEEKKRLEKEVKNQETDKRTKEEQKEVDRKAKEEKKEADRKAKEEKKEADRKAKEEKKEADRKAKEEKKEADRKAKQEKKEADRKAKEEQKEADKKAKEEKQGADKKAKEKKKQPDKKAKEEQKRDGSGSQREENEVVSQESSKEDKMETDV